MSDLNPAERLAKLRAVEAWLDWQLRETRHRIEQVEQQIQTTGGYVTEQERKAGQPVGVTIHTADCTRIGEAIAILTEAEARFALAKDGGFMHPCVHCHPEKELKPDWNSEGGGTATE
ncbi:DUF6233 domain-containing protein [Streptomyces sp. NPDC058464]|uniref:DUF6233 domain-containing protein n=1 Tax=Streptomyces sp. NPDC058464 TaxID=3346511 RepID=UPI003669CEE5